jgi:16S rRNA (uracil1498-N3)-methyltransferase
MGQPFLTRLYVLDALAPGISLTLDDKARHFLQHVLRAEVGDRVLLFNATDGEYPAEIVRLGKKDLTVHLAAQTRAPVPEPDLWLCFAPVKKTPADYLAQKAAELGVARLVPTLTARTIVTRINTERLLANAIEGAEQTGRLSIPEVAEPVRLMDLLATWPAERRLMLADESHTSPPLLAALRAVETRGVPWAILIGPEGGFTPEELRVIKSLPQTVGVSLGPRLLRADTAALAALTGWQMVLGDWGRDA